MLAVTIVNVDEAGGGMVLATAEPVFTLPQPIFEATEQKNSEAARNHLRCMNPLQGFHSGGWGEKAIEERAKTGRKDGSFLTTSPRTNNWTVVQIWDR
jgi:hypothetical protein